MAYRATASFQQALGASNYKYYRFTNQFVVTLGGSRTRRQTRVTQAFAQIAAKQFSDQRTLRFSTEYMQVLGHWTPNFEWIEMFIYEEFPFDISLQSIGAVRFNTDVVLVDSGDDQRSSRWNAPLMEYDIAYGVRTMEQLQGLKAYFMAVRGRRDAFLYKDPMDHTSSMAVRVEARAPPPISRFDQPLGIGDGLTKTFQLQKEYRTPQGAYSFVRKITKPKVSSVLVAVGGVAVTNFTVDQTNGKVTFTPPLILNSLPLLTMQRVSNAWQVSGSLNCFASLQVGQRIVMTGWINPLNNTTEALNVSVAAKPSANLIVLQTPAGVGAVESNCPTVRIYVHPSPEAGKEVRAGFDFWVPCRFDTDRLPFSLEDYGIGSAADVKLIEVRPGDE